jgi:hypothetical protein
MASGLTLLLFANAPLFYVAIFFLLFVGAAGNVGMVTNRTLLQTASDRRLRGRVMSASAMVWGMSPLGALPAGAIADVLSVSFAVSLQGALLALLFLVMFLRQPGFRKLE